MSAIAVTNDSAGWLVLWIEPYGEDRWLRTGETFVVRTDYSGDEPPFTIQYWVNTDDRAAGIENVTVVVNEGFYQGVLDSEGGVVECGHQRPAEIVAKWQAVIRRLQSGR